MKKRNPNDVPLEQWPPAWLKFECAALIGNHLYLVMHDHEKRASGYPVTDAEMRAFIKGKEKPPDAGPGAA